MIMIGTSPLTTHIIIMLWIMVIATFVNNILQNLEFVCKLPGYGPLIIFNFSYNIHNIVTIIWSSIIIFITYLFIINKLNNDNTSKEKNT